MTSRASGFTLIELIVVLAGLGMLSSLVIPNFIDLLDSNNVDEIKALLNSAAADCLQKKRSTTDPIVDEEIISPDTIRTTGYQIDNINSILDTEGRPKCSLLLLEPIDGDDKDRVRYNIGFQLLGNGKLDKLASTVMADKRPDCIKWAGKCEFSEDAKILEDYKDEIRAARADCSSQLTDWKKNMNPALSKQWDSTKGPDTCPLSPPGEGDTSYKGLSDCTTDGCTKDVWGLWDSDTNTGSTYSSKTAYEKARKDLIGEKCNADIKAKEDAKHTNTKGVEEVLDNCDGEYWFYNGNNTGSQVAWEKLYYKANNPTGKQTLSDGSGLYLCLGEEKATEDLMTQCINDNEEAGCDNQINEQLAANFNGEFVAKSGGPGSCSSVNWMCDGKNYKTDKTTFDEECKAKCGEPAWNRCYEPRIRSHPTCTGPSLNNETDNWSRCKGYI